MITAKIVNSFISSNRKMRYVGFLSEFTHHLAAGFTMTDWNEVILQDANQLYLMKSCCWCGSFATATGANSTLGQAFWWITPAENAGDMQKVRLIAAGAGHVTHNTMTVFMDAQRGLSYDYTTPDGIGLFLSQGAQLEIGFTAKTQAAWAVDTTVNSMLYLQFGIPRTD